ncbi:MAG: biotin/lipoate A/B protein ligase family protein [Planctomycetaceae bacterium]
MTSGTTKLPDADIIVDELPYSGVFNMSMDAALLQLAAERDQSVVRIYQWSEPTVSLGYFQGSGPAVESPFPGLPVVRRLSGGGAILHDREITYSLVLPASHPARLDPSAVYSTVHRAIIRLLSHAGVPCQLRSEFDAMNSSTAVTNTDAAAEPFLCFLRKNANDIVHSTGNKIVGSAQRRRKGVTLQHGSIILKASRVVPQLPGIGELEPSFSDADFRQSLPGMIASSISHSMNFRRYTEAEKSLAATIVSERSETC